THEYTHLVVQHEGHRYPPWLNEGFAELFSTLAIQGDTVRLGDPIVGRLQALLRDKWVPLSTILSADHDSPYYNETNKAGNLYNEGWALVHMLMTTSEYRPKSGEVLAAVDKGTPSIEALEKVYGKPLAAIENDLELYIRGSRFNYLSAKIKLQTNKEALVA